MQNPQKVESRSRELVQGGRAMRGLRDGGLVPECPYGLCRILDITALSLGTWRHPDALISGVHPPRKQAPRHTQGNGVVSKH